MAKLAIHPGSTGVTALVYITDTSGDALTGLAYNTAGLTCYYCRPGSAAVAVSLVTQTVTGAYTSGGFVAIDNMPGFYRIDFPNAMFSAGVRSVVATLYGASNMQPLPLEFDLNAQVNVSRINATTVNGNGAGTPWGP